ncbi:MtrAB system histidine kinase MtrB [Pseudolysinimonas sp.]|uniref:MtrAB system histidine kinase MtrB n=1 Tax=Pseudolysinimonas sp. TaxID=2680009 RepID=UPI003F811648
MRFDARRRLGELARVWRRSLRVRVIAVTLILSAVASVAIGLYISVSVRGNLYDQRRTQILAEAGRATAAARSVFEQAEASGDSPDLDNAGDRAVDAILSRVSSHPLLALQRAPGQAGGIPALEDLQTPDFRDTMATSALRDAVRSGGIDEVSWQSIALVKANGARAPGIVTGSVIDIANAGRYQLFLVYDLSDVQSTLDFVQGTLALGGVALVILIGAVAYVIVRLVVGPVREAAETSEKLAAGQLEQRLPERGDDELATLARSFNRMADSLQSQISQLADLSRLQQRFVSDVSHELRTPLTTIRLAGDVLYDRRDEFPPATRRTAELLHAQTQRFEVLLGDLLEMSRYDAGAVQLDLEPTNLVRLVEDAVESLRPLALEKETEVRVTAPGGYFEAEVDARRIRRILQNLLGNAIDHGEGRPIDVHVDSDAQAVAIAVRDHGIGMTPTDAQRVFDRFWRADPSRQRTTGGTGLGLAIAQEDAAVHGGRLEVWSSPGEGSCFRLTLPRRRGEVLRGSPLELPPPEPQDAAAPLGAAS